MKAALVLQTDFGLCDGAVSAMYGVALSVDPNLHIYDLTHEIPQYMIWDASYRLLQTIRYWAKGTVFVSVVDPGVGTNRLSVVAKTASGHYIVTPDNGSLTHIQEEIGVVALRQIDETVNRLPNSGDSYTFHGRDVYAYAGARLASGLISFEEVGPELDVNQLIRLPIHQAEVADNGEIIGSIDILDVRFGNLWTNLDRSMLFDLGFTYGDKVLVTIASNRSVVYQNMLTLRHSFAETAWGDALLFINSLDKLGVAMNQGSFAHAYHISGGATWQIRLKKIKEN